MSQQIEANIVASYENMFYELGQQVASRLQPAVEMITGIVGASRSIERAGAVDAYDIDVRHGDTKYSEVPHSRRWIDLFDKGAADLIDEMDEVRLLADPKAIYPRLMVAALNRAKDTIIYNAARGSVRGASGLIPLPAAQKIAEGGTGLTLAKLLTTKEILDAAEVGNRGDESAKDMTGQAKVYDRVFVVTTRQLTNLLGTTEIKSVDYNNVKALSDGKVDEFLGFRFIRREGLAKSSTTRYCVAWQRQAMVLGIGKDIVTSVDVLPTKNMATQIFARMSIGAARREDEGVVEVGCFE